MVSILVLHFGMGRVAFPIATGEPISMAVFLHAYKENESQFEKAVTQTDFLTSLGSIILYLISIAQIYLPSIKIKHF